MELLLNVHTSYMDIPTICKYPYTDIPHIETYFTYEHTSYMYIPTMKTYLLYELTHYEDILKYAHTN